MFGGRSSGKKGGGGGAMQNAAALMDGFDMDIDSSGEKVSNAELAAVLAEIGLEDKKKPLQKTKPAAASAPAPAPPSTIAYELMPAIRPSSPCSPVQYGHVLMVLTVTMTDSITTGSSARPGTTYAER